MKLTTEEQRRRWREKANRYYHAHKAEQRERNRQYREQHKTELNARARKYYQEHRAEIRAKQRPDTNDKLIKKREYERHYRAEHKAARQEAGNKSYQKHRATTLMRRNARKLAALEAEALRPKPECCEVCNGTTRISFDHCHQRGIFRGWLCHPCNAILGFASDDTNRLRQLIAYLERTKGVVPPQLVLPGL